MPTTATLEHLNSYWRAKLGLTPDGPQGLPSYFDVTISGNPYYSGLGWLDAWCLNPDRVIQSSNSTHSATLYSSTELALLPAGLFGTPAQDALAIANLDLINWVINQNYTANPQFNYGEVQAAMWKLLGYGDILDGGDLTQDGPVLASDVNIIYNAALTHDGFVPDWNQEIAIVIDVGGGQQPIIIEVPAAKLGDFVWHDANANGAQDGGEAGISGATVNLVRDLNNDGDFDDANELLATTTTDGTGYYEFKGLTPGLPYQVQFITPAGYDFASPRQALAVPAAGNSDGPLSDVVILAAGEFNSTIDSGFYKQQAPQPASLGDFVWLDKDADGVQDAGELGISGVTVKLLADTDNDTQIDDVVSTQLTDGTGFYKFDGLAPGKQYRVEFTNPDSVGPDAYSFSPRQAGGNTALDSDAALSDVVVLSPGEHNPTLDAGLYRKGSIHVYGFLDSDGDGTLDTTETAFPANPGKRIELLNAQNTVVATDVTDANGRADFEGLDPGTYTVRETPVPAGYVLTTAPSVTVTIGSGEERAYKTGAAQLPPGDGRTEVVDTSLVFGNAPIGIDIEKLVRGRYEEKQKCDWDKLPTDYWKCGSYVELFWKVQQFLEKLDADWFKGFCDGFGDIDKVIDYVKAYLEKYHDPNSTIIETPDYDADTPTGPAINVGGEAIFTYLVKNTGAVELSNVKVTDDRIPTLTFVGGDTDGDGKLDVNEVWKYTAKETVLAAQQYVNIGTVTGQAGGNTVTDTDAAHYIGKAAEVLKAKVGDRVWCDKDMDGVQDSGESGIAGVTVKLKDASGNVIKTTTTDYHGEYLFEVAPGTYSIQFVKPTNYAFTGQDKGGNDGLDSDANGSGLTSTFTLASGEQKLTIDAGMYLPGPKFFVVDTTCDQVYKYTSSGGSMGDFNLRTGNDSPTGIAANVDGSKLWVLDTDKNIYVHNANGTTAGQWKAGDLGSAPEGITVWGQDVWIVDSATDKIYWYDDGATFTSGTHYANKTFALSTSISNAKGIATDGDRLWLVNDSSTDKVFVFDIGGTSSNPTLTSLGSWALASGNSQPTGLTIDPTGSSNSIWVVDTGTDKVYEYANAKGLTSGSGGTPKTFSLADGNCNPTDIADPLSLIGQASVEPEHAFA